MFRRLLQSFLTLSTLALAATTSTDYVTSNFSEEQVAITVESKVDSAYSVKIPKLITITNVDKENCTVDYTVTVTGDIAGYEWITVEPDENFKLSQKNKPDIQASITQNITTFRDSTYTGTETDGRLGKNITGTITVPNLSAGTWSGAFKFKIDLGSLDHDWSPSETSNTEHTCTICGESAEHTIENGVCTICKKEIEKEIKYEDFTITWDNMYMTGLLSEDDDPGDLSGDIKIPETFEYNGVNYRTTAIGAEAFSNSNIESIDIPDSVEYIGDYAFGYCEQLTSIKIPSNVTIINSCTFFECHSLTNVELNDNLKSIENSAFYKTGIISIKIPDSVVYIGECAFGYCDKLEKVELGEELKFIGVEAFTDCTSLASINLNNNLTYIGECVFWRCSKLDAIELGENIKYIGGCAFYGSGLSSAIFKNTNGWYIEEDTDEGDGYLIEDYLLTESSYNSRISILDFDKLNDLDTNFYDVIANIGTEYIDPVDISDEAKAAEYLTSTYDDYCWVNR